MESLRAYLAKLTVPQQHEYAERAGTSLGYLRKSLSLGTRFGGVLARRLDEASGGEVSRYALRPDIFGEGPGMKPLSNAHAEVRPTSNTPNKSPQGPRAARHGRVTCVPHSVAGAQP